MANEEPSLENGIGDQVVQPNRRDRTWWLFAALLLLVWGLLSQRQVISGQFVRYAVSQLTEFDQSRAEKWLGIARIVSPGGSGLEAAKARIARRAGDFETAEEHLKRAEYLRGAADAIQFERLLILAQSGRTREVEPELGRLLSDFPGQEAEVCRAFVLGYIRGRNFAAALTLLSSWAADYPKDPSPLAWSGQIYAELKSNVEAEEKFRRALEIDPKHPAAALGLAQLLFDNKRTEESLGYFEIAASAKFVGTVPAIVGLVKCLRSISQYERAERELLAAMNRYPDETELVVSMADLRIEAGKYQEAIDLLEPAIERGDRSRELHYAYATALRSAGDSEEAATHFEYVSEASRETAFANQQIPKVAESPDDPELRYEIGSRHLKYGNSRDGLLWLQSALAINPNHQKTHQVLAAYYRDRISEGTDFLSLYQLHQALGGTIGSSVTSPDAETSPDPPATTVIP